MKQRKKAIQINETRQIKEMKLKVKEMLVIFAATLGFWGLFYPNFGMTDDVCRVYHIEADSYEEESLSELLGATDTGITIADLKKGKMKVKSKLWEFLEQFFDSMSGG